MYHLTQGTNLPSSISSSKKGKSTSSSSSITGTPTFTSGDGLEAFELIDLELIDSGLTTTGNSSGSESNAPWITS
jgi:hypothetical protein